MFNTYAIENPTKGNCPEPISFLASKVTLHWKVCVVSQPDDNTSSLRDLLSVLGKNDFQVTWLELLSNETHEAVVGDRHFSKHERLSEAYKITQNFVPVQSACAYHWLRQRDFDFIIFHHGYGAAYYACMAKRIGLAFKNTSLVILAATPLAKKLEESMRFPETYQHFEQNFLERETVAKADAAIFLDIDIFSWIEKTGWSYPSNIAVREATSPTPSALGEWLVNVKNNYGTVPGRESQTEDIFVSVCVATFNRPLLLKEALQSLSAQTYRNFEVIVVDDGSHDARVDEVKTELSTLFRERGWRWKMQSNAGPSAARNYAASLAKGTHLLFMDDDNLAYPEEIERFALAARSGVDILTCLLGIHPDSAMSSGPVALLPDSTDRSRPLGWIPLGNCLELAPFINRMGDTNALIRRETFLELGGFQGSREMVLEDFEFFIRASLAGFTIEVVPEILVLYRRGSDSRSMGNTIFKSHLDSLKPIAKALPPQFRNLLLAVRSNWYSRHCARRDGHTSSD